MTLPPPPLPPSPGARPQLGEPLGEESQHCLSALMDGQSWALPEATRKWRDEAEARRTWHAYHLIGDVLRSDELAHSATRDEQFLVALRGRLASEPVLLAPPTLRDEGKPLMAQGSAPVAASRRPWVLPVAAVAGAAGVAAIAVMSGVLVLGPAGSGTTAVPALAAASGVGGGGLLPVVRTGSDGVIRDPRLDEYLRAHQAARSGVVAGVPGSALRSVDTVLPPAPAGR